MAALKLLSGVRQVSPDRGLFASRDGKRLVMCLVAPACSKDGGKSRAFCNVWSHQERKELS